MGGEGDVADGVEFSGGDPGERSSGGGVLDVVDGKSVDSKTSLTRRKKKERSANEGKRKGGEREAFED